jgi:hypothetical protein
LRWFRIRGVTQRFLVLRNRGRSARGSIPASPKVLAPGGVLADGFAVPAGSPCPVVAVALVVLGVAGE